MWLWNRDLKSKFLSPSHQRYCPVVYVILSLPLPFSYLLSSSNHKAASTTSTWKSKFWHDIQSHWGVVQQELPWRTTSLVNIIGSTGIVVCRQYVRQFLDMSWCDVTLQEGGGGRSSVTSDCLKLVGLQVVPANSFYHHQADFSQNVGFPSPICLLSCFLTAALLPRSFRSSFTPSSIKPPLGGGPQSSCLDPLLFLFYSLLRRGRGREDLHVCTPTADLLSDLLKNKIIAYLCRKDWIYMKENVMCLVCREKNIGVCNLVNGRKVVNCININPSWLSNINRPNFKLAWPIQVQT